LIVDDMVYVVTGNGVDQGHIDIPAPDAPSFLALDKRTGAFRWDSNLPTRALAEAKRAGGLVNIRGLVNAGKLIMHGQWSSPVHARAKGRSLVIFPGGDGWLYAFKPDNGELLWKFNGNPPGAAFVLGPKATRLHFLATPVVWEDRLYIALGEDPEHRAGPGRLFCIDVTKEPVNAEKDVSPNAESALVWHYGGPAPPGQNRPYLFARSMSTCAVHDGLCYAADYDGYVYCLDARSGALHWEHDTEQTMWSSPYWVDGKVYFGNDDGDVFVFKHGKQKNLLQPAFNTDGKVRATPVVAHGMLYVLTENNTRLLALGKK
jgi:outer membrane protein assembly factor BamB